jgi:hypothetical protein
MNHLETFDLPLEDRERLVENVRSDPKLTTDGKQTTINFANSDDWFLVTTDRG